MSCEQPKVPSEIAELSPHEPICPGDSGIVVDICPPGMVEQKIAPARWENRWEEGDVEKYGASTIVYLHEAMHKAQGA